jgi:hypothetical protein
MQDMTAESRKGQSRRLNEIHVARSAIAMLVLTCLFVAVACGAKAGAGMPLLLPASSSATVGPLRLLAPSPRYFSDAHGHIVYLTGSHTWNTMQDWGSSNPPPVFDYPAFLDFLQKHHHNFTRLFVWEQSEGVAWTTEKAWFAPLPYVRTGPGKAIDGAPKFDLHSLNPVFFTRLHDRVSQARDRGIYVSVMLFNGWSVSQKRNSFSEEMREKGLGNPWLGHPFNRDNNVNGIDGDFRRTGEGAALHTLEVPAITALEKAYVEKVIHTLNDLDNVLWEICNECEAGSELWQYEIIRFIKELEVKKPNQHPVGMTAIYPGGTNRALFESPADWISPADLPGQPYKDDPPSPVGKVILSDTDHLWGVGGDPRWVWKSICRGLNPIYMDPYHASLIAGDPIFRPGKAEPNRREQRIEAEAERVRRNLGYARLYAERMDLVSAVPRDDLPSTRYCLAAPGKKYLIYLPADSYGLASLWAGLRRGHLTERVTLDLSNYHANYNLEWFQVATGEAFTGGTLHGGEKEELSAPFRGDAVLFLSSQLQDASAIEQTHD